jgi:hypothetical protein
VGLCTTRAEATSRRTENGRCREPLLDPGRILPGSSSPTRSTARASSSVDALTKPVTPSSTTSGTEPLRQARTGVPHAMASIITRPNGSSHWIGRTSAATTTPPPPAHGRLAKPVRRRRPGGTGGILAQATLQLADPGRQRGIGRHQSGVNLPQLGDHHRLDRDGTSRSGQGKRSRVGYVNAFMQLGGTRGGARRASHVDARRLGHPC